MRRLLIAAALCAPACAASSTPSASPQTPTPSPEKKLADDWSCFGLRFNLGVDGLHTSMCQKTPAKCEAAKKSFAPGEGQQLLVPTTDCVRQPYAYCYVAHSKAGKESFQCTRNELECNASQELQGILGNQVGSSCQLATKEPLAAKDHRWFCFGAAGPGGGSVLCEPAKVACEATRSQLTKGKLHVSPCSPLDTDLAYCAQFGESNAMCTPTAESCNALRESMAPTMSVPVAACKATKPTCSSSSDDGAHCTKPARL